MCFSSSGDYILSSSDDGTVKLWDVETGEMKKTFSGISEEEGSCAFISDHEKILSAPDDKTLRLWDIKTGKNNAIFLSISSIMAISAEDPLIVAGDFSGYLYFLRLHFSKE